ncbi:MAG: hypothetical protein MMC33_005896 [Icmadophila ericetorum]|nr:hypothetical protein [Icmadophila ericetorum]
MAVPPKQSLSIEDRASSITSFDRTRPSPPKSKWSVPDFKRGNAFDGRKAFSRGKLYQRPERETLEESFYNGHTLEDFGIDDKTEYWHRDFYGKVTYRKKDVLRYISPTDGSPKHMVVQATTDALNLPGGDWRRTGIKGSVPIALRLSEWALGGSDNKHFRWFNFLSRWLRLPLMAPAILVLLALPIHKAWEDTEFTDTYTAFPNYYWDYPMYARNSLDMRPVPRQTGLQKKELSANQKLSYKVRLLRPRQLVVFKDGDWVLDPNPAKHMPYIFISFSGEHFRPSRGGEDTRRRSEADRLKSERDRSDMEQMAQREAIRAGVQAYWWEPDCAAPNSEPELKNSDVYRFCDVIRGAQRVCVLLPEMSTKYMREWGSRMWCLPEAMLSQKPDIYFCSLREETQVMSKLELSDEVWDDGDPENGDNQPTRVLAEHYSNVLTLSRLELFSVALEALANKQHTTFTQADLAYALMGLLSHRVQLTGKESLFFALARLSLANDSDRLVERMISMYPHVKDLRDSPHKDEDNIFRHSIVPDQYGTQLWDIEPLCQVTGIGEDGEVVLDGCKGLSIRWKGFPQMQYKRSTGFRKLMAELCLRSGAYLSAAGFVLVIHYAYLLTQDSGDNEPITSTFGLGVAPSVRYIFSYSAVQRDIAAIFFGALMLFLSFIFAIASPFAVVRLYGGRVTESAPWLCGFEGVMPVKQLERIVFGNYKQRLTYEPSSTPFCDRDLNERIGKEPDWVTYYNTGTVPPPALPKGHRFFTLVDTGNLTVSIFSAVRPPSVALITGKEGGMLRTVLCHYERSNNCLYKEAVLRMDSLTLNQAKQLSWIKVSLGKNFPKSMVSMTEKKV